MTYPPGDSVPTAEEVAALAEKVDRLEAQIAELCQAHERLRAEGALKSADNDRVEQAS